MAKTPERMLCNAIFGKEPEEMPVNERDMIRLAWEEELKVLRENATTQLHELRVQAG